MVCCLKYREQVGVGGEVGLGVGTGSQGDTPRRCHHLSFSFECQVEGSAPLHPDLFLVSSLSVMSLSRFQDEKQKKTNKNEA